MSEKCSCFVCGPSNDHECDSDGPGVILLNRDPYEVEDTPENQKKYELIINGGSVSCSQCGRSSFSNAAWI